MIACEIVVALFLTLVIGAISAMLHELSHALMCRILNVKLLWVKALFLCFDGKKLSFMIRGKSSCVFKTNDTRKMKQIVAAGPIVEIIIAMLVLAFSLQINQLRVKYGFIGGSILIIITTVIDLLPISNGDGKLLFTKGD